MVVLAFYYFDEKEQGAIWLSAVGGVFVVLRVIIFLASRLRRAFVGAKTANTLPPTARSMP